MKKVFVKGWIMDHYDADFLGAKEVYPHSLPVRFKMEDGTYDWIWVRKNNVRLCPSTIKHRRGGVDV